MIEVEVSLHYELMHEDSISSLQPIRYRLSLADPGFLKVAPSGPSDQWASLIGQITVISDGSEVLYIGPSEQAYYVDRAPGDWRFLLGVLSIDIWALSLQTVAFALLPLIPDNPFLEITEIAQNDICEKDGRTFRRLRLQVASAQRNRKSAGPAREAQYEWTVWLEESDPPLPKKIQRDITIPESVLRHWGQENLAKGQDNAKITLIFNEWIFSPAVDLDRFAVAPPEGSDRVPSRLRLHFLGTDESAPEPGALVGQPAPNFTVKGFTGESTSLDSLSDTGIIVLDFWATWCTPCVRALPHLMAIEEEYREHGVMLYTLNLRETPDKVVQFLKERGWNDLRVGFDHDGQVARQYHVHGIPQTVIIDSDGIIRAVHTGFSPILTQQLRRELDAIAADERKNEN